jgi:hypothetical protein
MSSASSVTITLDRRLLRHPRAYHLRRMRMGIWVYLDLLARLPAGAGSLEIDPAVVAGEVGVKEGFVRSWLGHLSKAGYVEVERLNGTLRVTIRSGKVPEPIEPTRQRFFTVTKLQRALGDPSNADAFETALREHSDAVIRRALAGTLAVPENQIRRSRTALFLFLLKRHAHATT